MTFHSHETTWTLAFRVLHSPSQAADLVELRAAASTWHACVNNQDVAS